MSNAELAITRFVQKWIADPLQFSGVSLSFQIRASSGLVVASWLGLAVLYAQHKEWPNLAVTGLAVFVTLAATMFELFPVASSWQLWIGFLIVDMIALVSKLDAHNLINVPMDVGALLYIFLKKCEPKPPCGNLKSATEGV